MNDAVETESALLRSAVTARLRVLETRGEERCQDYGEDSWQRVRCHMHREDVSWAAIPILYALGALSFADARPRESSEIDYREGDTWSTDDLLMWMRLEHGELVFDADYVRGRMMKTRIKIGSDGTVIIETRNRYHMAHRWLDTLRGRKHLRLAGASDRP